MKKFLLLCFVISFSFSLFAQLIKAPAALRNYSVKVPITLSDEFVSAQNGNILLLNHSKAISEEEIGQTVYDLATNESVDNRIYLYSDGTVGATFTGSASAPSYPDRGTYYNYYDGSAWLTIPTARLETVKTGWPSYSHLGLNNEGEIVISHQFGVALIMLKRAAKGTGVWSQTTMPNPSGIAPAWPRVCTSGNSVHVLASASAAYQGQTNPIVYYRSIDAGANWNILGVMPTELTPAAGYTYGFGGDAYDWAEPQGNTLAYVIGSKTSDLILMKSIDNGSTWTKTVIFQHPYPNWTDLVLALDTPYVCDGAHAVSLDASGNAHVVFGLNRFLNDDTTDASYSYFPGVDGLAYWKEGDPAYTSANPDDVYAKCKLIGYLQDLDASGIVLDNYTSTSIASYQVSTTSQPQITIGTDGTIYVIFRSLMETMMSGGGQFYSHIWGRKSTDGGDNWTEFVDLTSGPDHEMVECVFGAMSKTEDGNLHILYQSDFEPGTAIGADADVAGTNSYMYLQVGATDFSSTVVPCTVNKNEINLNGNVNIYPNPVLDNMNVTFSINKSASVNMTIFNALGSVVKNSSFIANGRGQANEINIKELPTGMYLVKFETASGTYTQKIVKK